MKPRRRAAPPRQGESLLDGLFRRLGLEEEARAWRALATWSEVAGPQLRRRTRAERLRGDTLVVRVASSSWAQELGFLKQELLEKLRATPGGEGIRDLRFTVGPLGDAPDFDSDERSASPAPPPPTLEQPPRLEDPEVAAAIASVGDPQLRIELARLISRASRR